MSGADVPLLAVRDLEKHYPITRGLLNTEIARVRAVDGVSFELRPGETLGIVGESGCGKSTLAETVLRLEEPTGGEVLFKGDDVTELDGEALTRFRREAQMIFQDPESSFDPRMSVGQAVAEPLRVQGLGDRDTREAVVRDLLERVGLQPGDVDRYPHEFSGGQKQRLGLARALSVNPDLLVADEPVSALDVSIQSEILQLIDGFQEELGLAVLVISHDLAVVRDVCDRVAVMYLGEFVEVGPTEALFSDPRHPYTRALLGSIPTPDPSGNGVESTLAGTVPDPSDPPSGCRFHTRCPEVIPPESIDLPQDTWRKVLSFRTDLESAEIDPVGIVEAGLVRDEGDYAHLDDPQPDDVDGDDMERWIRQEYGLPETLADSRADRTVTVAIEAYLESDHERAAETMRETFTTVCERESPELTAVHEQRAACHLNAEPWSDHRPIEESEHD